MNPALVARPSVGLLIRIAEGQPPQRAPVAMVSVYVICDGCLYGQQYCGYGLRGTPSPRDLKHEVCHKGAAA